MKTIIIYSTKYGSVEKAARMLKGKLDGEVLMVNVMREKVPAIDGYDNVILAGSIYMGRIQKELTEYITANMPQLMKKRVGLFICAGSPQFEARLKELETVFPGELYSHAAAKELFGYEIDYNKLGFLDKMVMKAVKGDKNGVSEFYEDRMGSFARAMNGR